MGERQVPIWNVPFPQNLFFTGREDILASLHTLLTSNQKAALTKRQALSGLGGIGKTQTALEYAYRYRHGYQAVLWVKCETPEEFIADVVALAHLLHLPQQDAQDQQLTLAAVKRWLETHTEWLLSLDNADDLELVRTFLPGGNSGHILLTTRSDILSGLARKVEITAMREEEGTLLLLRRAGIIAPEASIEAAPFSTQATARALVDEMGGLPLALDQAGAYIEETKCGPAGYLTLYRAH